MEDNLRLDLDDFPKEILEHIISYMKSDEQINMRLANTKWFKLVNYRNFIFKFTTEKTLPLIVNRMLQYNGPIGLDFVNARCKKLEVYAAQLSRLTNLTSLELPYCYARDLRPEVWWGFTTLTNLREWRDLYGCPASVTASLINLRQLTLDDLDTLGERVKKMSNLEHLSCQPKTYQPLDVFSVLPCPARLTSLNTNGNFDHTNTSKLYNLQYLYYNADNNGVPLQWSLDKFTALNSLSLSQKNMSLGALPTTLTHLMISGSSLDPACHQHLASLHNLKELNVDTMYINNNEYSWISHMTSLEQVTIWPSAHDQAITESYTGEVYNMIKSSKLVKLLTYVMAHVDLGHLSRLTTLEDLVIYEDDLDEDPDTNYSFVSHLTRLTSFIVYPVDDRPSLTALASLENLKVFKFIASHDPSQVPMSLERLTRLEHLVFKMCEADVFRSLSVLTRLTCLETNCLPDINYEFLRAMPLQNLKISENANDRFYTVLVQLTGLRSLKIQGLSAEQVIGLSTLQHLKELDLINCEVDGGKNLTRLTKLQELSVKAPRVDSALLETSLPHLIELRVRK